MKKGLRAYDRFKSIIKRGDLVTLFKSNSPGSDDEIALVLDITHQDYAKFLTSKGLIISESSFFTKKFS